MNKTIEMDPQDMSVYSSSSSKTPVSIINEYALKNNLVPNYELINHHSSLDVPSFKCIVNLGKFVGVGEGPSKKEAKHLAASNLFKKMINDNSQLLNTDFNNCTISPYDNNIQGNTVSTKNNKTVDMDLQDMSVYSSSSSKTPVSIINEYALKNNLVPNYEFINHHSSLGVPSFKYIVNLGKFVGVGEGPSKKEAKHLAASNLLKKMINDNSQLLNTDFNNCTISPYDNKIQVNAVLTKNNKAVDMDLQDMSVYSSSSSKTPVSIINEYALKNNLVPNYEFINHHSSLGVPSFKCIVNLGKFVGVGEGSSKKEAKHLAASNLFKKMINDNSQLLNTDFNNCTISPYDNNIQVNTVSTKNNKTVDMDLQDMSVYSSSSSKTPVSIINEYALKNNLVPNYEFINHHSSLGVPSFKYIVNLGKFVGVGEGPSKKEAKHLAASNLLKKMINDNSQLLNTDFNNCTISPYDNNIQVNAVLTKNNKAVDMDLQDMSVYSSSSSKTPVSIINEYALKNNLVPNYDLINQHSSLGVPSFKCIVNMGKFVGVGKGPSKKKAKHLAASNLFKKMINDNSQLLNTDFNNCTISPYDNNIQVNTVSTKNNKTVDMDLQDMSVYSSSSSKTPVSIINEYALKNNLVPNYDLINHYSSLGVPSFKYIVNLGKFVGVGEGLSKKGAKHLAASNLLKKMINDNSQLLNTDFNNCTISPYDNNIQVNTVSTKNNKTVDMDLQDMSVYSNSSNKTPLSIINEYAAKNNLVLHINLIHDGSSLSIVSFQYSLTLGKFVGVGEGPSKKEAKHLAAANLLKKLFNDNFQLLNTDFNNCTISPYDNNIQINAVSTENNKTVDMDLQDMSVYSNSSSKTPVSNINIKANYISKLNDICRHKNIVLPEFHLVKEEGLDHEKLFTISCHVAKFIETATQSSKKQAKYLAAFKMLNTLMSSDTVIEKCTDVSDSIKALEKFNKISWPIKKSVPKRTVCRDYHLLFKKTEWKNSVTLNMVFNQYIENGKLDLPEPYNILQKIVTEHKINLNSRVNKIKLNFNNYHYSCTFALTDVYPHVYGFGVDKNPEMAQHIAIKELLIGICILLK